MNIKLKIIFFILFFNFSGCIIVPPIINDRLLLPNKKKDPLKDEKGKKKLKVENKTIANKRINLMKGVILAGGYGTRFLPITKTIPKEMLPLVDRPAIDFIVEEFILSGVTDILIVTSRRKKALEDYFDREIELENNIFDSDKLEKLKTLAQIKDKVNIFFIRQQEMKGTGHAVLICKNFLNTPFILAFPDDIIFSETPLSKQLIDIHKQTRKNVLAVLDFKGKDVSKYGVIKPSSEKENSKVNVKGIVEKPKKGTEPSSLVSIGRYLLDPEIFPLLEEGFKMSNNREYFLTDAINLLAENDRVVAHNIEGKRYDTGDPLGYLKTLTEYALSRDDLSKDFFSFLKNLVSGEKNG